MPNELTLQSLNETLTKVEAYCREHNIPATIKDTKIPVYFSPYALPEASYVPTIGIVCRDQAALDRYLARVERARLRCGDTLQP